DKPSDNTLCGFGDAQFERLRQNRHEPTIQRTAQIGASGSDRLLVVVLGVVECIPLADLMNAKIDSAEARMSCYAGSRRAGPARSLKAGSTAYGMAGTTQSALLIRRSLYRGSR